MNKPETNSIWVSLVDDELLVLVGSVVRWSIRRDSYTEVEAYGVCFICWSEPRLDFMVAAARL